MKKWVFIGLGLFLVVLLIGSFGFIYVDGLFVRCEDGSARLVLGDVSDGVYDDQMCPYSFMVYGVVDEYDRCEARKFILDPDCMVNGLVTGDRIRARKFVCMWPLYWDVLRLFCIRHFAPGFMDTVVGPSAGYHDDVVLYGFRVARRGDALSVDELAVLRSKLPKQGEGVVWSGP